YSPAVVDILHYPLGRLIPLDIGEAVQDAIGNSGVKWYLGRYVAALNRLGHATRVSLDDGRSFDVDSVLSAVGLRPRTQLAAEAGLSVDYGIKVDVTGRTSDPHIYALGDCAEYAHGLSAYVTPIMAAARAIAQGALGTPTEIRFPPLSVQVKTTACPVVLLPAPRNAKGKWIQIERGAKGLKYLFRDEDGKTLGYALTGELCAERVEMDRMLSNIWQGLT
ncbi:MAG: FAD-dependent oxidoreductase, partial [Alphaproteobacteria bacterium]|nr:FAD-dependent oxidoreductase [Alphaproteobacteria bacterium]